MAGILDLVANRTQQQAQQQADGSWLTPEQIQILRNLQIAPSRRDYTQYRPINEDEWVWQSDNEGNQYRTAPQGAVEQFFMSGDNTGTEYVMPVGEMQDIYDLNSVNWDALRAAGLQSKYNQVEQLPDGTLKVTMQRPGMHKYDTFDAYYRRDPQTGQMSLVGGNPTRQVSSGEEMRDALEEGSGIIGGAILASMGMYNPAMFGTGALGAAGAGAAVGGGLAAAQGGGWDDFFKGAARGGLTAGLGDYFIGSGQVGSLGPSGGASGAGGYNALDDYFTRGATDMGVSSGAGGYAGAIEHAGGLQLPEMLPDLPGVAAPSLDTATAYPVAPPSAPLQTVNITGSLPAAVTPGISALGALPSLSPGLVSSMPAPAYGDPNALQPGETAQIEVTGSRDNALPTLPNTVPVSAAPPALGLAGVGPLQGPINTGPAPAGPPSASDRILDWVKKNPIDAANIGLGIIGGVMGNPGSALGGLAGGAGDQSNLTAVRPEAFRRQYIAPPEGYRPGFDPEHKFFTGIGTMGTGSGTAQIPQSPTGPITG